MSVRSRIAEPPAPSVDVAKVFGPGTPASFRQGEEAAQMTPASPFSPGTPIGPYDGFDRQPRAHDFVTGYNIATRPRTHERVSFETLKGLIEAYDIAQLAIMHRIDSMRSLDWKLVAADDSVGDVTDVIAIGMAALKKPDRINSFETWFAKWMWDVLAYDAGALYRLRNRAGRCVGLSVVSGPSIAPLLDYWGNPPGAMAAPGEPLPEAYVQYVNGLPWNWLTRADLIYEPFRPRPDSPYGHAPLESIILNANTDLRFQVYFLERFTSGNLPAAFASAPDSWSPDQIDQFQALWDSYMYGNQEGKHQVRWMPPGSKFVWSNEKDFSDVFSLFLMRKSLAAYHVVPADMGFTENVNKSSGESQADVQHRLGDAPLARYASRILTGFIQDDLGLPLKHMFDLGEEQDDRLATAQSDDLYAKMGAVSVSEIREMRFGRPEPGGKPVPRFVFSNRAGPIPLSALEDVAGPVDDASGAPAPGTELPHKEFTPVEGVVPVPPPHMPGLAEREYGPGALPPGEAPALPVPVAKEGEAAPGITSETGIYGDPLIRDDDEDEDQREAAVKSEFAAFRRFERARRKNGEWRDFRFAAVDPVAAHNLNDDGRLAVRKAAGEIAVAGLAVLAADTGRVLMLQRALCDDDPAGGKLEFPGGHLDGTETPLQAAWREFAEETGCAPPPGVQTGTWTGANQIYQGIVWTTDNEASVPVRGEAFIPNPDDPDGDAVEAVMWVDPSDLPGNPMLRPELVTDLDAVMAALGVTPNCCGAECCQGACCGGASGCHCGATFHGDTERVVKAYPDGQSYGSHAFRPTPGMDIVCWYCGMARIDPFHRDYPAGVAKAGDAGPKAPALDTRSLTGVWAEVYGRRNKLLAKHQRAVAAAWDACIAELGSPAGVVRQFRSDAGKVAKLADPHKPWWKETGTAAALAWLQGLYKTKGWPALVAALEASIAEGMAEGEADALALAADKAGKAGFAIGAAFTAALTTVQGDPDVSQQAQDAASGMVGGAAGDIGSALADRAGDGGGEQDMTAAASDAVTGSRSQAVEVGTDWKLYAAILAGAVALYQRAASTQPAAPSGPEQPPVPPVPPAAILLDWITAGDSRVCPTCDGYASSGPYAPENVPDYPHARCRCSVDLAASSGASSFLGALLDSFAN